jgi:hypothetical protein
MTKVKKMLISRAGLSGEFALMEAANRTRLQLKKSKDLARIPFFCSILIIYLFTVGKR